MTTRILQGDCRAVLPMLPEAAPVRAPQTPTEAERAALRAIMPGFGAQ